MARSRTTTITRRNRETGTMITVCESDEGEIAEGIPWMTVCDDHGSCVCHETLAVARSWASKPSVWCEDCRVLTEGERGREVSRG